MKVIETGVWRGSRIRNAHKAGRCHYWRGQRHDDPADNGRCPVIIEVGDKYFDGELNPHSAGGFGRERYCMAHETE